MLVHRRVQNRWPELRQGEPHRGDAERPGFTGLSINDARGGPLIIAKAAVRDTWLNSAAVARWDTTVMSRPCGALWPSRGGRGADVEGVVVNEACGPIRTPTSQHLQLEVSNFSERTRPRLSHRVAHDADPRPCHSDLKSDIARWSFVALRGTLGQEDLRGSATTPSEGLAKRLAKLDVRSRYGPGNGLSQPSAHSHRAVRNGTRGLRFRGVRRATHWPLAFLR
jgi:hypothetical protein